MELVTAIAGKIAEYSVEPITRQVDYVIHCKSNLAQLEKELNDLTDARRTIDGKIAEAETEGANILEEVGKWVEEVHEVTRKANQLKDESRAANLSCVNGRGLNLRMRRQLSKQSIKLMKQIGQLSKQSIKLMTQIGRLIRKSEIPDISSGILREEVSGISTGDYLTFNSRESAVEQVMDELKNPNTVRIRVCGIGGVGKTTLVKQVFKKVQDTNLFDKVVILFDVKSIPHLEKIQKQIVEKLEMGMIDGETILTRTARLCGYIEGKKILIILDDVQNNIDLEPLGVPCVVTCKILLTSRIPISGMSTDKGFKLGILPEEEAWELFANKAGVLDKVPAIHGVAKQVAKKCGGLPLLVVTVASSLKDRKSLPPWEEALRCLKQFDHTEESPEKEAHSTIEWSYNQLDDSMLKYLFLLCGTTVRGNHICSEDLFKYSMGLSLFKNVHKVEHKRNAFYSKVKELKDFCLLLDGDDDTSVRMHDIVRNAARHIALRDHQMLSAWEDGGVDQSDWKGWPNKDFVKKCTTISFPSANNIPEVMQCPALKMLLLQDDQDDDSLKMKILPRFFEEMKQLTVLSLERMHIPSLPSSLQFLNKLQTLCLHRCGLGDLSLVGQLKNLKILSFEGSHVEQLPKEIGQLTHLRLLDLSKCYRLGVISPGVISSLERLEELRMRESFKNWEAAGDGSNANLFELKRLSQLTTLEVHVPDAKILPADFLFHELKRFKIMIGDQWQWNYKDDSTLNTLKLKLPAASSIGLGRGLKKLLTICDDLSLYGAKSFLHFVHHLDSQDCQLQLRNLHLQNNYYFGSISKTVTFPKLSSLVVHQCKGLIFMLSSSTARSLIQLKHLEISECEIMEAIVSTNQDGGEITGNTFPQLQHLQLKGLPNLSKFCSASYIEFPSLKRLQLEKCAKLETFISQPLTKNIATDNEIEEGDSKEKLQTVVKSHLFDKKVSFPNLETLIIDSLPKFRTIWHNQLPPNSFNRLKDVVVQECNSLINIFAPSVMGRLNGLSTLYIQGCESLEVVFKLEDIEVEDSCGRISAATQLKSLYCQNLDSVYINRCGNLTNIFPSSVARVDRRQLIQKLTVDDCGVLEEFVAKEEGLRTLAPKFVFPKLASDTFENLPQLGQALHVSGWPVLKTLVFSDHGQVEIFAAEYSTFQKKLELGRPSTINQFFFLINKVILQVVLSNLTSLIVHRCDNLRFLLSSSMAKSLVQLKHLQVSKCEIMEEIILSRGYGEENMDDMFSKLENLDLNNLPCLASFCSGDNIRDINFPKVKSVTFRNLPQLTSFCSGMYASKWPLLETLELYECYQVKIFAAEFLSFQNLHQLGNLSTPIKQPFFLIEKGSFANLESLSLDAMQIWYGPPGTAKIFIKLKSIDFLFSKRPVFLQRGSSGHGDETFPDVKKLRLNGILEKLRHLWKENPQPAGPVFPNLKILLLEHCHRLENIPMSSAISFQNLTILEVTFCWRLRYLTSYSIAKSLVHLQKLKVDECKSMTEIVAIGDGDGEGDDTGNYVIAFSRLQHLELYDLISLQRFCPPNCIVKMPSSISLRVNYCPVQFKISPDCLLLLEEEDASNFQQHDQAESVDENFNNEDSHLNVQSHSQNRHAGDAAVASSSGTNQNQPAQDEDAEFDAQEPRGEEFTTELNNDPALPDIPQSSEPQSSEQGVDAVIQETPLFSKSLEQAEVMDLKKPVVTKNLQEADLGPIQYLNLIAKEDEQLQLQAGSRSQRIVQIDAVMKLLQELRDKEVEMRNQEKKIADR